MTPALTEILVCTTCRRGLPTDTPGDRPGKQLYDGLAGVDMPEGVVVKEVECLSNCNSGCSIVLRSKGKWTYVYGNLHEASHLDVIVDGATRYHASNDGLVPWRERPEYFRKNCIARIPPIKDDTHD